MTRGEPTAGSDMRDESRSSRNAALLLAAGLLLFGIVRIAPPTSTWTSAAPGPSAPALPLLPALLVLATVGLGRRRSGRGQVRGGAILVAVGLWLLLGSLELGGLDHGDSWPLLLVAIGVVLAVVPETPGRPGGGLLMIGWGALCWIAVHRVRGIGWSDIWPIVIVLVGLQIIGSALSEQRSRKAIPESEVEDD